MKQRSFPEFGFFLFSWDGLEIRKFVVFWLNIFPLPAGKLVGSLFSICYISSRIGFSDSSINRYKKFRFPL